ncbi:PEP-CTERM sorting domain-containing protein [Chamaesiphon sp. VAR_48_metabat_403]|uniref:PEP-CTERM sorting domain-containing protein n=1 Tax=Chamaesiphon sp. VAR_48_metabat_403 TaxID=2964700 RepID=UPI00286D6D8A|nr:PEP-CTERM sorting domain-containing protein [Chamaesiphon sp. VAR_48_metabat_403]
MNANLFKYVGLTAFVISAVSQPATAAIISFNTLVGANGDPYLGSSEAGFTITPTLGNWFQGQIFGNPTPSIFAGPISSPSPSQINIVDSTLPFTFAGVDLTSNTSLGTSYTIQGSFNGALVLNQVVAPTTINTFQTFASTNPTQLLDKLTILGTPGNGVSSFNIDNINVTKQVPVPEPFTIIGTLIGGMSAFKMRKKLKATNN